MSDSCCKSNETSNQLETISHDNPSTCCGSPADDVKQSGEKVGCCSTPMQNDEVPREVVSASDSTYVYRVEGMDCPSCAVTLQKGILSLQPHYEDVSVSYGTASLKIESSIEPDLRKLKSAVSNHGFNLILPTEDDQKDTYIVTGMDCSSCAATIEKHFSGLIDVHDISVHFSRGEMEINHDLGLGKVQTELRKIGFDGHLKDEPNTVTKKSTTGHLLLIAGLLIGSGMISQYLGANELFINVLYAVALALSGGKAFRSAIFAVRAKSLDMNVLMSVAAIGAALIGEWLEGATVVFLFAIGNLLQARSLDKTRDSIKQLVQLAPKEATVLTDGGPVLKSVESVQVGERILVRPGDQFALDGTVVTGQSSVNQAPITGESVPVDKWAGEKVFAGTMNIDGALEVFVDKSYKDTTLSTIISMVEEAQDRKAPSEEFIDRFSKVYTPIVFVLALILMVIPPLLQLGTWGEWFYKGLELIVIACPCALVISTPVAIVTAIGNAARNGVLLKGGVYLEKAAGLQAIAFDKTGTLTRGKPSVQKFISLANDRNHVLQIAYSMENQSNHPLAKAIVEYAENESITPLPFETNRNEVGNGIIGEYQGDKYFVGSVKWFEKMDYDLTSVRIDVNSAEDGGNTLVLVGNDEGILGMFLLRDEVREESQIALRQLKEKSGIQRLVMLTGDSPGAAAHVAEHLVIDEVHAGLLPEEKVDAVKKLKSNGFRVAMVGDGINDAPAFVTSDLSIAMGGAGTDTALETADVVLMADNLEKLPYTIDLSKATMRIIKQNITFSIVVKVIAMLLVFPGWLTLWMAVLSDTGAAVLVTLNALLLMRKRSMN
ncbi:cation-translocating P-type ATPase [Exiguobacterium sp. ERU653]|uniref:heavy metal translocating P-type ATPase n=2 Tax=unclassified Exiguobacterium TaxID=2644629 RepID=UPI001BEA6986|nr:cation-translocating P-type ATPase [Exiguobacterium sp. ERU653]